MVSSGRKNPRCEAQERDVGGEGIDRAAEEVTPPGSPRWRGTPRLDPKQNRSPFKGTEDVNEPQEESHRLNPTVRGLGPFGARLRSPRILRR